MRSVLGIGLLAGLLAAGAAAAAPAGPWPVAARSFQLVERVSGPVNYYSVAPGPPEHVHSRYQPGFQTAVVGYAATDAQARAARLSWRWRAITLPAGGDECRAGKGDSAAVVYVSWKRALRYYTLKYVWSAVDLQSEWASVAPFATRSATRSSQRSCRLGTAAGGNHQRRLGHG